MTSEELSAYGFFFIGMGIFFLVMLVILRDDKVHYDRKLNEMREFGMHEDPQKWAFRRNK